MIVERRERDTIVATDVEMCLDEALGEADLFLVEPGPHLLDPEIVELGRDRQDLIRQALQVEHRLQDLLRSIQK